MTDARPDTDELSGATHSEVVSRGKIDPDNLSDTVGGSVPGFIDRNAHLGVRRARDAQTAQIETAFGSADSEFGQVEKRVLQGKNQAKIRNVE